MSKQKVISKHPIRRRTTFKKHTKRYAKVYAPYLPAIIGLVISLSMLIPRESNSSNSVLSYATSTSKSSLLNETNEKRTSDNLHNLNLNSALSAAAQAKADDMADKNYWSHVSPSGEQPWQFIEQSGYKYSKAAENLAYGFSSSKDTVNGWMNSSEHRKAMLDSDMTDVGFGISNVADYQGQGEETIVVALYAQPQTDATQVNSQFGSNPASSVSLGQVITGGKYPWLNFIAGITIGLISMYLIIKHSLRLRRWIRKGERYVLRHPVVDITLISLLALLIVASQTAGFIQ